MKTIAIPQFYCGPSGQKGLYNRQEVGLARAFAALGCRAVVLYPAPGAAAPTVENPEPNVKIYYLPVRKLGAQAFFSGWQVLLDEQVDAVHVMGDNSPGVPSLYRFCRKHGILFYSQLGALKSTSGRAAVRAVMDLLLRRNLAVYKKTPTFAKTPAVAAELQSLGVPCAGLMPVGLDTAIIPDVPGTRADLRRALKLDVDAKIFVFVGRLDAYKKPLDLVPLLEAAPDWQAVIIGPGHPGSGAGPPAGRPGVGRPLPDDPPAAQRVCTRLLSCLRCFCKSERSGDLRHEPAGGHVCRLPASGLATRRGRTSSSRTASVVGCAARCPSWPRLWAASRPRWALLHNDVSTSIFCGRTVPSWR